MQDKRSETLKHDDGHSSTNYLLHLVALQFQSMLLGQVLLHSFQLVLLFLQPCSCIHRELATELSHSITCRRCVQAHTEISYLVLIHSYDFIRLRITFFVLHLPHHPINSSLPNCIYSQLGQEFTQRRFLPFEWSSLECQPFVSSNPQAPPPSPSLSFRHPRLFGDSECRSPGPDLDMGHSVHGTASLSSLSLSFGIPWCLLCWAQRDDGPLSQLQWLHVPIGQPPFAGISRFHIVEAWQQTRMLVPEAPAPRSRAKIPTLICISNC